MDFSRYTTERKKIINIMPLENHFKFKREQTIKYESLKNIFISDEDIKTTIRRRHEHTELSGLC
jgi:hypothetical protein